MRPRGWLRAFACAFFSAALACAHAQPSTSPGTERAMPLEVIVNGSKTGTWILVERGGVLYAPAEAFEEWRVQVAPDAPAIVYKGQQYRSLAAVPGFKSKLDSVNQTLDLLFAPQVFSTLKMTKEIVKRPPASDALPSAFFNYDVSYTESRPREGSRTGDLGVIGELGLSTSLGVVVSSFAGRNLADDRELGLDRKFLRLETTFVRDFPERNQTLRIGDTVTRPAMWGRDVYFGGVRFGSNFALSPGFISQPLPALGGVSSAPSTVELYVNDVLRQVSNVPTGPFVIDNFPQLTGNGEARIVVRDLLGRETVVVQPFFTSSLLLAPDLDDWSVEAGKERIDLGVASDHYGDGFASGTWRHGLSDTMTVEARAEATRKQRLIGVGWLTMLPWQVLAKAALVGSGHDDLGSGGHWLVGFETQSLRGGASLQMARSTPNFREVGQDPNVSPIKYQVAGNAMYVFQDYGTAGVGFATIARFDGTRISTLSGNYSMRIGARGNLTFTASRAFDGGSGSAVAMTLLWPLDSGLVTNATAGTRSGKRDAYVAAVQNPGTRSDLGWRVLAGEQQDEGRAEAGLYYQGERGSLTADAAASRELKTVRLGASGGIVMARGSVFATRRVDESFAIVEVEGYKDIPVGIGGNTLAHTDAHGLALVPRLLPYMANAIRLDPKSLPINAEIDSIEAVVVPPWRSGVVARFPVRSGRGALLRIVLDDGEVAPPGAIVRIEGDKEEFYVARKGESYVTGLKPDSRVRLRWKDAECPLAFELPPDNPDAIARVGPVRCKGVAR